MRFELLSSSTRESKYTLSKIDKLPIRESGQYIEQKHSRLAYYSDMFATAMKQWKHRVYLELYAGPGRCLIREGRTESEGSPLKVLDLNFTRFIFIERDEELAEALKKRIQHHPRANSVEIWNGDNFQALEHVDIPKKDALTFSFVDPTGLVEMSLIRKIKEVAPRGDMLINLMDSMGIKMNRFQYKADSGPNCRLTRMLGHDGWKKHLRLSKPEFYRKINFLFKEELRRLHYLTDDFDVKVTLKGSVHLYSLVFAAGHQRALEFWQKAVKGTTPQTDFLDQL